MEKSDGNCIRGIHYSTGKAIEVNTTGSFIESIREIDTKNKNLLTIAPGLIDIQINGYKGYDFNKKPLDSKEWHAVVNELLKIGITTFYPTIITNSINGLSENFKQNSDIVSGNSFLQKVIGGFHLEGPYISTLDGPRGAHEKEYTKPPDWEEFCQLQKIAKEQIKLITMSPEWKESIDFIKRATKCGVKVAIGHTAAHTGEIKQAVASGAVLSTHLGNGAHVNLLRHPNYIWDQLAEDDLWASVISDGHHLPKNVLHVFNKVKKNKLILVSDCVALAGMQPGDYTTSIGGEVTLTENGRLHLKNQDNLLAGSAQNLLQGVQYFVENNLSTLTEAINKASVYPAQLMGLEQKKGLSVGAPADIILLDNHDSKWNISKTFKNGVRVF